jgi:hypothetical protein
MLIAWVYATEQEARDLVAAIDSALGPTEDVRLPDGTIETRPRKTWAHPATLRDGTWAVPYKPRLAPVLDRTETVRGEPVRIPRADETRTVTDEERGDGEDETAAPRER